MINAFTYIVCAKYGLLGGILFFLIIPYFALFEELGMNLSTAFNIFVRQSLRERDIPFSISEGKPSHETVSAMLEAERIAKDPSAL